VYQTPPAQPEPHQHQQQPYPPEFYQEPYQQQPYQQQPYQQQPYQERFYPQHGAPRPLPTSGLAVASLVLGILWLGWLGSILAVIFGHLALRSIRRGAERGWGLAVAGLVLGYIGVATLALVVILAVIGANTAPSPRSQARSTTAPVSPAASSGTSGGAPAGAPPAGYRWLGSAAAGVWFAVPRSWAAVNLAKLNRSQAARHFALQGVSSSQFNSLIAGVSRQHGVVALDLASIGSSPGFATNANAFCESTALSSGGVDPSALQSAMRSAIRAQYSRLHAHVLRVSNATIDGNPGVKTEITLTSTAGLTVSETQYIALSSSGRACYVTLSTANRAASRHVFNEIGATIHVS